MINYVGLLESISFTEHLGLLNTLSFLLHVCWCIEDYMHLLVAASYIKDRFRYNDDKRLH